MKKRFFTGYVKEAKEDGILSVAIATDSSIDRDGERIDSDGWDLSNFMKNPVLLWAHDYRAEPLGKVIDIRKEGDKILFTPQFAVDISEHAKQIFELYKEKFLNAFSVGFIPKEWKDIEENGKTVRVFTKLEMLEISAVPVPSNPNALVLARGCKGIDDDILNQMEKAIEKTGTTNGHAHEATFDEESGSGITDEVEKHQHRIRDYKVLEGGEEKHTHTLKIENREVGDHEQKGVIGYKDHGIVENLDAEWNGSEEVAKADVETLKQMSTWFDNEEADNKGSYKLPHHEASDLKAIWRGVSAAMAALLGARGGVKIPEEDREGVYNHLSKHYKQFDKNPPEFKHVENQILKEVDLGIDAPIVVNVIDGNKDQIATIEGDIKEIKETLADNGENKNLGINELINSSGFQSGVLKAIDKAMGKSLRDLKRS